MLSKFEAFQEIEKYLGDKHRNLGADFYPITPDPSSLQRTYHVDHLRHPDINKFWNRLILVTTLHEQSSDWNVSIAISGKRASGAVLNIFGLTIGEHPPLSEYKKDLSLEFQAELEKYARKLENEISPLLV